MAAKFEIAKASNGQHYFRLKAGNGEVILTSEQYAAKANAKSGVESAKANAPVEARYARGTSKGGKPYFVLKATNGKVLGRSQMYASEAAMEKGVEAVKAAAPAAAVEDLT